MMSCALHRHGPACSRCAPGYHRDNAKNSGPCKKCSRTSDNMVLMFSLMFGAALGVGLLSSAVWYRL